MSRKKDKCPTSARMLPTGSFRVTNEVRYIQRRAARREGRVVAVGPLVLFSTETGDAWLLDPADRLAAPLARGGEPVWVHIEEDAESFAIGWTGSYRLDGPAFVYTDDDNGRVVTILGYPIDAISQAP